MGSGVQKGRKRTKTPCPYAVPVLLWRNWQYIKRETVREKVESITGKHKAGKRERSARAKMKLGNINHIHTAPMWESPLRRGSLSKDLKDRKQKGNTMPWDRRQQAREELEGDCRKEVREHMGAEREPLQKLVFIQIENGGHWRTLGK